MDGASVFSPRPRARRPRATSPRAIVHDLIRCHRVASRTMTPRSASQKGGARVVAVRLVVGSRSRSSVRGDRPIDRMSDHIIHHSVLPHTASQKSARVGDNAHDGKSIVHVYFPPYEKEAITRVAAVQRTPSRSGRGLEVVDASGRRTLRTRRDG